MKKILAISASNQTISVNTELLKAAIRNLLVTKTEYLLLSDINLPVYSTEGEMINGIPVLAHKIHEHFTASDGFILACPEHNGLPPACFKNMIDWLSRIDQCIFQNKKILLLSTSPGSNGGNRNLQLLSNLLPGWGGDVTGLFSLGKFQENFDIGKSIIRDPKLQDALSTAVHNFEMALDNFEIAA